METRKVAAAVERQDRDEIVFVDPAEKKPVAIAPEILAAWEGDYEIGPGMTLTVVREEERLFLLINGGEGGKTELFPLSAERFFVRSVGPSIEVAFEPEKAGRPAALILKIDGREMKGPRKGRSTSFPVGA